MGDLERRPAFPSPQPDDLERELLHPNHFYAAYVYEDAAQHDFDITTVVEQAHQLGYPTRYWWLSSAIDLEGRPDRLIVCVHHPSRDENAGMDLYTAIHDYRAEYTLLEAATVEEYEQLGRSFRLPGDIRLPSGERLFPNLPASGEPETAPLQLEETDGLIAVTVGDVQSLAQEALGRLLTPHELSALSRELQEHLDRSLLPLITKLAERPDAPLAEGGELSDYLVSYVLSGYTLTRAESGQAASRVIADALARMLGRSAETGITIFEAEQVRLHELDIVVDSIESTAFAQSLT